VACSKAWAKLQHTEVVAGVAADDLQSDGSAGSSLVNPAGTEIAGWLVIVT
jgi:hypothetical protein